MGYKKYIKRQLCKARHSKLYEKFLLKESETKLKKKKIPQQELNTSCRGTSREHIISSIYNTLSCFAIIYFPWSTWCLKIMLHQSRHSDHELDSYQKFDKMLFVSENLAQFL